MQYEWEYSHTDGWMPASLLPDGSLHESLREMGYRNTTSLPEERCSMGHLEIWEHRRGDDVYPFVAVLCLETYVFTFFLRGFPDLVALAKELYPLWQMHLASEQTEIIQQTLTKLFRAWHGHDWEDACYECDHLGAEIKKQKARERLERRKQREKANTENGNTPNGAMKHDTEP